MSAEAECVINVESGQDVCNPVHYNTNQNVRKQGILGKLKLPLGAARERRIIKKLKLLLGAAREQRIVKKLKLLLGAAFSIEEEAVDEEGLYRDSKTSLIILGVIMAANYTAITSVPSSPENRDEGLRQAVLIPATLSMMTILFVMAVQGVMPKFSCRRVKMLVALCIIFTACSYINFVAMKLGSTSQGTIVTIVIAAIYMFFIAIVLLCPKFRIKTPQAWQRLTRQEDRPAWMPILMHPHASAVRPADPYSDGSHTPCHFLTLLLTTV